MLLCTTWKARPLAPDQIDRMMAIWGKMEADQAENANVERLCWFMYADGSGGLTVNDIKDPAGDTQGVEFALALGEFLELETRPVHDLDSAMPAILSAIERMKA